MAINKCPACGQDKDPAKSACDHCWSLAQRFLHEGELSVPQVQHVLRTHQADMPPLVWVLAEQGYTHASDKIARALVLLKEAEESVMTQFEKPQEKE